ncbi:ESX-1 secretion-associated protein [Mycobacterium sp. NPDC003449]
MTQPPLRVSGQIRSTSTVQAEAASKIDTAKSVTDGSSGDVFKTHGLVCSATAMALKSAELSRRNAAEKMHLISTDLAVKLKSAATEYEATDQQGAGNLDSQMPPR